MKNNKSSIKNILSNKLVHLIPNVKKSLFVATAIITFGAVNSYSAEYHVNTSEKNMVKFISDAPLEDFEGETNKIDGFLITKSDQGYGNSDFYFEVDLNDVDTGIGLRNSHMREDYLYTDKWPFAKFDGKILTSKKNDDGSYTIKAKGTFEVKGEKEDKTIKAKITGNGSSLSISTNFIVNLVEHDIEVPSLMGAKISEDIVVKASFDVKKVD